MGCGGLIRETDDQTLDVSGTYDLGTWNGESPQVEMAVCQNQ
jgi:hypothetical protein